MNTTQEALQGLVNYEKISTMPVLEVPTIKKEEIPNFILQHPHYDKAMQKIEQKMQVFETKLKNFKNEIDVQKEIIQRANAGTSYVDRSSAQSVARYNDWVERGRKAAEKHDDLIDKHNETLAERDEKLQELVQDALAAIEEDIVTVLDKCTKIATKLSGSQNSQDLMTAIDVCFIEMKIHHFFEDVIEGNIARKEVKERISEVDQLFAQLCGNEDVRNHITDLFRRNLYLMEKNDTQYGQITQTIGTVDQQEMNRSIGELQDVFNKKFDTDFDYERVIDPSELENINVKITERIKEIENHIAKANQLEESTKPFAEQGTETHQNLETLLESMKSEVKGMGSDLILPGYFGIEMLNESVIDDFYSKDIRPKVKEFRDFLSKELEEEKLDMLIMTNGDRFSIQKTETAIKQAGLTRLQNERSRIKEHIEKMNKLIVSLQENIEKIKEVPKKKSEELRKEVSKNYILSFIPFISFLPAFKIFKKIKSFESAFRSTNQIYRDIGATLLAKNKTMFIANLVVGAVLSIGSLIALLVTENSLSSAVQLGLPGTMLLLYLISSGFLFLTGKKLDSYLGYIKSGGRS